MKHITILFFFFLCSCNIQHKKPTITYHVALVDEVNEITKSNDDISQPKPKEISQEDKNTVNYLLDEVDELTHTKKDFISPLEEGTVILDFGVTTIHGVNKGINIAPLKEKSSTKHKVISSTNGTVIYADYSDILGNTIMIRIPDSKITVVYAHLDNMLVNKNDSVSQADIIGYVGNTGRVNKNQLHFAIYEDQIAKNPAEYLDFNFNYDKTH